VGGLDDIKGELIALLPRMQRYARNLTFSAADADELVQSTCVRVLEKHHQYQPGTNFDRWVFRVMSTVRNNHLRTLKRQETLADNEQTAHSNQDTETNAYHAQVLTIVKDLAMAQRQVMLLVYFEGFSYQETADILEVPIGTVMSRISRARNKLAEHLT